MSQSNPLPAPREGSMHASAKRNHVMQSNKLEITAKILATIDQIIALS